MFRFLVNNNFLRDAEKAETEKLWMFPFVDAAPADVKTKLKELATAPDVEDDEDIDDVADEDVPDPEEPGRA